MTTHGTHRLLAIAARIRMMRLSRYGLAALTLLTVALAIWQLNAQSNARRTWPDLPTMYERVTGRSFDIFRDPHGTVRIHYDGVPAGDQETVGSIYIQGALIRDRGLWGLWEQVRQTTETSLSPSALGNVAEADLGEAIQAAGPDLGPLDTNAQNVLRSLASGGIESGLTVIPTVPWLVLLALFAAELVAWLSWVAALMPVRARSARRIRQCGWCPRCGYATTGLDGACPECGREREREA